MNTCKQCHSGIHESFLHTGMGKSIARASKAKSSANFQHLKAIVDTSNGYQYLPYWKGDSLIIKEFRIENKDTVFQRAELISYIIGSGQHTNSHLIQTNSYLYQAPLTYYTQDEKWDLPPGFEAGASSRFNRILGLECISCHNAYPSFIPGSENKFKSMPEGIDCERCHGPGEVHVAEKQKAIIIDTSKYIDYSIVNPAKLPIDKQFDLCQRCHLQGNTVLKDGKSFLDFKPGMNLSDVMEVYLPRYKNSNNSFIMASHADRLQQSKCFVSMSSKRADAESLRPYKNALTCVTCHNPHVSVKNKDAWFFINQCVSCHTTQKVHDCSESLDIRNKVDNNCISCHMPTSSSIDIPHVTVHDHYIRKEAKIENSKIEELKEFIGLECINNPNPSLKSKALGYLQQFEKFDFGNLALLDSSAAILNKIGGEQTDSLLQLYIHHYFLSGSYDKIRDLVSKAGHSKLAYFKLIGRDLANKDAWTAYRIAEAFQAINSHDVALLYYYIAHRLAPYYFDFTNKYGNSALLNKKLDLAQEIFSRLAKENPNFAPAWSNLGYIMLIKKDFERALFYSSKAINLDYTYLPARLNKAGGLYALNKIDDLKAELELIIAIDPDNERAKSTLKNL